MTREEAVQLIADCPKDIAHYDLLRGLHAQLESLEDIRLTMEVKVKSLSSKIAELQEAAGALSE